MDTSPFTRAARLAAVTLLAAACASEGPAGVAGADGSSCTLADNGDGTQTLTCDDGSSTTVADPPPVCVGPWRSLQWDGTQWICVDLRATGLSEGNANGFEAADAWGFAWDGTARPARTWAEANADCQALGGRLPTVSELHRVNPATGTGDVGTVQETVPLWSNNGPSPWWTLRLVDGQAVSEPSSAAKHPYRCAWPDRHPTGFDGNACQGPPGAECVPMAAEGGRYRIDAVDRPGLGFGAALRECAFLHGHLATELALGEAIQQGLGNGSGNWLRTSEHLGYDGANFTAGAVRWSGTNVAFADANPTDAAPSYITNSTVMPFRCMGAAGPLAPTEEPGSGWVDAGRTHLSASPVDLGPAGLVDAIVACRSLGGHLPTQRDLGELIQGGLPDGSNTMVLTADLQGASSVGVVRWTGTAPQYDDSWSIWATWTPAATANQPFRCAWFPVDGSFAGPAACNGGCFETAAGTVAIARTWADTFDRTAVTYGEAMRACAAAGGHLATFRDLAELIREGLPNGSNVAVWTSDLTGSAATSLVKWTGAATDWAIVAGDTLQVAPRNTAATSPYRCVWSNELRW